MISSNNSVAGAVQPNPALSPSAYYGYGDTSQTLPTLLKLPHDVLNLIAQELAKQNATLPLRFVCKRIANLAAVKGERFSNAQMNEAAENAIAKGSTLLVLWYYDSLECPLTLKSALAAAQSDNRATMQWLHIICRSSNWDEQICAAVARLGRLEILQWARENGCPWDEETWEVARESVRPWLRENGCPGAN